VTSFSATLSGAAYGRLVVVETVSIAVEGGRMAVILGSNGAGKTTTLRAVFGTVTCASRSIALDGEPLDRLASWRLPGRGLVLVPDGARCFPNMSVRENLHGAFVAVHARGGAEPERRLLGQVFELFPVLRDKEHLAAGTLSGGQRQMLAIGRALMTEPRVLVLDEPSAGLAPKIVEELFEALARIKAERGCAIVMAEQNVGYATRVADHCLVLEEGRVVLDGPMATVRQDERLRTAYLGL
jgi:branched-chain amino acid transport system ATP-binding protein